MANTQQQQKNLGFDAQLSLSLKYPLEKTLEALL